MGQHGLISVQDTLQKLVLQERKSLHSPMHSTYCFHHFMDLEDQYLSRV